MLSTRTTRRERVNVVTLIGNLATDVELRDVADDRKLATFVLAVNRTGPAGGADFVRVAAWNKQAESCGRYLAKGKRVAVDGRLRSRSWEEADGKRRTSLEVVANAVEFLPMTRSEPGAEAPFEEATMST
jgi:single-strand DNA-binding protein